MPALPDIVADAQGRRTSLRFTRREKKSREVCLEITIAGQPHVIEHDASEFLDAVLSGKEIKGRLLTPVPAAQCPPKEA